MGCDIHLFVETREPGGAWRLARVEIQCDWCDGTGEKRGFACWFCKGTKLRAGFSSRNYDTFAVLANVRNGSGFAGVDTGDGFVPIAEPRGLPEDMSPDLALIAKDEYDEDDEAGYEARSEARNSAWGESDLGDHSESWVTLAELLAYDWKRTTNKRGQMALGEWAAWKASGNKAPENYCGACTGRSVRHVSETVAAELAKCITFDTPANKYDERRPVAFALTEAARVAWVSLAGHAIADLEALARGERFTVMVPVQWTMTYAECSKLFHDTFIPALLAQGNGPDNTRIVFGFDS